MLQASNLEFVYVLKKQLSSVCTLNYLSLCWFQLKIGHEGFEDHCICFDSNFVQTFFELSFIYIYSILVVHKFLILTLFILSFRWRLFWLHHVTDPGNMQHGLQPQSRNSSFHLVYKNKNVLLVFIRSSTGLPSEHLWIDFTCSNFSINSQISGIWFLKQTTNVVLNVSSAIMLT